jgi:hypothetical protein
VRFTKAELAVTAKTVATNLGETDCRYLLFLYCRRFNSLPGHHHSKELIGIASRPPGPLSVRYFSARSASVPGYDDGEALKLELPLAQSGFSPLLSAAWLNRTQHPPAQAMRSSLTLRVITSPQAQHLGDATRTDLNSVLQGGRHLGLTFSKPYHQNERSEVVYPW